MAAESWAARRELVVGGQRSGKSRCALERAAAWLAAAPGHAATLVATARPSDDEMQARILRHQADRARTLPAIATIEEPWDVAGCIARHSRADTLLVVDCLTLWLANRLWPTDRAAHPAPASATDATPVIDALAAALAAAPGPVVLVSNEIGMGVTPMGREVRAFVDAQGQLNQRIAQACDRVTLMAAGCALRIKGAA